ncbi:ShlB/FhaC/HecB family hemolysin secretion/activation protein [Paraburkholderia caballeronis]|uniref:ShlB/FhaC/HecB family hemolysin secretion/activation protein n=1 Tax=Paraburkholderia caballeronis TaxID=416943 RepID=UPI0010656636|nr:ShlB/FhaC/HecB family hemolysin secretion/activation protein [Paraburkholderia caballeronis]TDV03998.1 hemolysin activation/secretion protein [Paraburkholderia caballeronis]TDV07091.1 hemolysin activation/secretion protein [Paraburkholderia caballeronis]TDV17788.1 hemolysin activation/secretion protein [Paraburkholderia caballeronis]
MKHQVATRIALRPVLLALAGVLPSFASYAAGPALPGAGTLLQQAQPPAAPVAPSNDTGLTIERPAAGALPPSTAFPVEHVEIAGNTSIATPVLHALVADAEGKKLTLPELGDLARRITDYYHAHGFPLARAIVPQQTIQGGTVRIDVIEARFGSVVLNNGSRVSDRLLNATLGGLQSGAVVTDADLDRSLLLLSDIPGLGVTATLKPGAQVGTSDLVVGTSPQPLVTGSANVDNSGDRATGRARFGAAVNVINPLHLGDVFSVSGLTSGRDMNYGRVSYDALLNGAGTRAGVSYSALRYRLGGDLSPLGASGDAQVASVWAKHPFVRSRNLNVYGQLGYDHLMLDDDIDTAGIRTKRHLDNVTAALSGDVRDSLLAGAVTLWNASWTYGHVSFGNADAESSDAGSADTQGGFSKWNLGVTRLQGLSASDTLYVSVSGQWSSANLDSSQRLIAGGPTSVRAYDTDAISADTGYLFTAELRHSFATTPIGQWQAVAFVDAAHVAVNRHVFAGGSNSANLGGVGVGVNWIGPYNLSASASLAVPVGGRPELAGSTASARAWLTLAKGF